MRIEPRPESFSFTLETPGGAVTAGKESVAVMAPAGFNLAGAPVVKAGAPDVAGKVVVFDGRFSSAQMRQLSAAKPALIVVLDRSGKLVRALETAARRGGTRAVL